MLSLTRGLDVLVLLNERESVSAIDVSRALKLPRATTYRLLESLSRAGFVQQHASDHRFRLTQKVRLLSRGFSADHQLACIAKPYLIDVTKQLKWPVSLGTLSGLDLIVRENTDAESPLAADRFRVGYRMPLVTTATGLCILAYLDVGTRSGVLDALAERDPEAALSHRARATLEQTMKAVRERGFASFERRRLRTDATSIAVPVIDSGLHVRGAITIRYAKSAVNFSLGVRNFVPIMRDAARQIAATYEAASQ